MIKTSHPLSVKGIITIARNFRKEFNIKEDEAFPVLDVIDILCSKGLLSMQVLDNDSEYLGENRPALYNTVDNFIYIKESVLEEIENGIYRSNFTLAHELFHYIQNQVFNFTFIEVEECKASENVEWQANEFAGELLVPSKYLMLEDEELVERFHVSLECVLTRKVKQKRRSKIV